MGRGLSVIKTKIYHLGLSLLLVGLTSCVFGGVDVQDKGMTGPDSEAPADDTIMSAFSGSVQVPATAAASLSALTSSASALQAATQYTTSSLASSVPAPDGTVVEFLNTSLEARASLTTQGGQYSGTLNILDFLDPEDPDYVTMIVRTISGSGDRIIVQLQVIVKPLTDFVEEGSGQALTTSVGADINPFTTIKALPLFKELGANPMNPASTLAALNSSGRHLFGRDLLDALRMMEVSQEVIEGLFPEFIETLMSLDNEGSGKTSPTTGEELEKMIGDALGFDHGPDAESIPFLNVQFSTMMVMACHKLVKGYRLIGDPSSSDVKLWDIDRCFITGECVNSSTRTQIINECAGLFYDFLLSVGNKGSEDGEEMLKTLQAMIDVGLHKLQIFTDALFIWARTGLAELSDEELETFVHMVLRGYDIPAIAMDQANMYASLIRETKASEYFNRRAAAEILINTGYYLIDGKVNLGFFVLPDEEQQVFVDQDILDTVVLAGKFKGDFDNEPIEEGIKKIKSLKKNKGDKVKAIENGGNVSKMKIAILNTEVLFQLYLDFLEEIQETFDEDTFFAVYLGDPPILVLSTMAAVVSMKIMQEWGIDFIVTHPEEYKTALKKYILESLEAMRSGGAYHVSLKPCPPGNPVPNCWGLSQGQCGAVDRPDPTWGSYAIVHAYGDAHAVSEYHACYWDEGDQKCYYWGPYGETSQICLNGTPGTCGNGVCEPYENPKICSLDCLGGTEFESCWAAGNGAGDPGFGEVPGAHCNCYDDCSNRYCNSQANRCTGEPEYKYCLDIDTNPSACMYAPPGAFCFDAQLRDNDPWTSDTCLVDCEGLPNPDGFCKNINSRFLCLGTHLEGGGFAYLCRKSSY
ncbi:MAG: hypothetical protein A3I75_03610 [Deltaproteobacteria bacterium RIFCSPLOWO2_02_FULL_50_16]|nr:MAG: hypothetical protein A3I75_03610 [Deltaproteobacteria bacterium RIFCSPLOWO2_02_FULL_50_16]